MKHFYCSLFGHDYKVVKNVTYHVKEYKCKHCNQHVTTNGKGNLVLMTPKYKEINSVLKRIHDSKTKRKALILDR